MIYLETNIPRYLVLNAITSFVGNPCLYNVKGGIMDVIFQEDDIITEYLIEETRDELPYAR